MCIAGQVRDRLVLSRFGFGQRRGVVDTHRTPVSGEQFEQLISGRLAVERSDGTGECFGVGDHLFFGDLALRLVVCMRREHVAANPKHMLNPQVAQRHLCLEDCAAIRGSGWRCSGSDARQDEGRDGEERSELVREHLLVLPC